MIETTSLYGQRFLKGIYAKALEYADQADQAYSLAMPTALGVQENSFTALFKTKSTTNAQDVAISKTGLGLLGLTPEGQPFNSDSRLAGYTTVFNYDFYTNGVITTLKEVQDRATDLSLEPIRDLMIAGKQTMNKHAFNVFNYAFTAQTSLPAYLSFYGDGKPMASTVHPRKDGGTAQSNASATSIPLTEVNFEVGRLALQAQLDEKGLPGSWGSNKVILVVPNTLEKLAMEITGSTLKSGTANNDMNVYYGGDVTVISSKWLNTANGGLDTQWFVVDAMRSPLRFITREPLIVLPSYEIADRSHNISTDIYGRWSTGWVDYHGVWGSKGNGASYSS
jgi:hypothetical protein